MFPLILFQTACFLLLNLSSTKGEAPPSSVLVFTRGEGGYYCHKIPYLLRTTKGSLIALAEGRGKNGRDSCDDFSGTDLVMKRSNDNGNTWSALQVFYSNSSTDVVNVIGNAAPVEDASTGRIWVPFCRNNEEVYITYSDDDGVSWAAPVLHPELVLPDWKWVGLGPPGGLQLSSGRLLIPSYHTNRRKGDGCISRGHTLYSDDHGLTWAIGSSEFGSPFFANECQAVELKNGSVLINARSLTNNRIQVLSHDGGLTFDLPNIADSLIEPMEGCEGSIVRDNSTGYLYFSDPHAHSPIRLNMTIFRSTDEGQTWQFFDLVDRGSVSYSSLQIVPSFNGNGLELLYERSNNASLIFEPDEIVYWRVF